ncbi:MAG: RDD family protein [Bacteroidetes bacterium]|nr:MAG: RDD family protein [Bacteroidota bacterium]
MESQETSNNTGTVQLATEGQRIAAYFIDGVLIALVSLVPAVGIIVGVAYALTKDALPFLNGQSIGKNLMKIRVVSAVDGSPMTNNYGPVIVRGLFLSLLSIIELIVMLTNDQKQRVGDMVAKTKVVEDPNTVSIFESKK